MLQPEAYWHISNSGKKKYNEVNVNIYPPYAREVSNDRFPELKLKKRSHYLPT